jgi:hypothetical protein
MSNNKRLSADVLSAWVRPWELFFWFFSHGNLDDDDDDVGILEIFDLLDLHIGSYVNLFVMEQMLKGGGGGLSE